MFGFVLSDKRTVDGTYFFCGLHWATISVASVMIQQNMFQYSVSSSCWINFRICLEDERLILFCDGSFLMINRLNACNMTALERSLNEDSSFSSHQNYNRCYFNLNVRFCSTKYYIIFYHKSICRQWLGQCILQTKNEIIHKLNGCALCIQQKKNFKVRMLIPSNQLNLSAPFSSAKNATLISSSVDTLPPSSWCKIISDCIFCFGIIFVHTIFTIILNIYSDCHWLVHLFIKKLTIHHCHSSSNNLNELFLSSVCNVQGKGILKCRQIDNNNIQS